MNHRAAVGWLTSATLFSLSCSILPPIASEPELAGSTLPAVATTEAGPDADDVARVRAALERRGTGLTESERDELACAVVSEAAHHGLETELVLAVMHVESRFNTFAVSPVGALGLMQIMPATGEELAARYGVTWRGRQTLFDPLVNVKLGVAYLKELSERYDSVPTRGSALPTEYTTLVSEALSAAQQRRRS
jgi:soluble lytic murein transglycosylase-like protein